LRAILKLAKPRDWPKDFALNHAHYAKGASRESMKSVFADTFYFSISWR
jgi:hypothetical protein